MAVIFNVFFGGVVLNDVAFNVGQITNSGVPKFGAPGRYDKKIYTAAPIICGLSV